MTMEIEEKLPQLVKMSTTFKLVVPKEVEEKIRYLIRKYPSTEWSGVLFYNHAGTFEEKNLVITCKDIYPMDLGTSGWTEFYMSEDVASYMAQNIELFDCETGLVHSHHKMGAFFSSQDIKMLQQEGNDTNCFVSLIVDTKGTYQAAITRKVSKTTELTVTSVKESYEFFGEGKKELQSNDKETKKSSTEETIEYYMMNVERCAINNPLDYLDDRFDEIVKKKERQRVSTTQLDNTWDKYRSTYNNYNDWERNEFMNSTNEASLPASSDNSELYEEKDWNENNIVKYKPDPKKIRRAVARMITGSLIINPEKSDIKQWVKKYMRKQYSNIFHDSEDLNKSELFQQWMDFIIDFTMESFFVNFDEDKYDLNEAYGAIKRALQEELMQYYDMNEAIPLYYNRLTYTFN